MSKFIKLTLINQNEREYYVNADKITFMEQGKLEFIDEKASGMFRRVKKEVNATAINLANYNRNIGFIVKESIEEILNLIKETESI